MTPAKLKERCNGSYFPQVDPLDEMMLDYHNELHGPNNNDSSSIFGTIIFLLIATLICAVIYRISTTETVNVYTCYNNQGVEIYRTESTRHGQIDRIGDNMFRTPENKVMVGICDYSSYKRKR